MLVIFLLYNTIRYSIMFRMILKKIITKKTTIIILSSTIVGIIFTCFGLHYASCNNNTVQTEAYIKISKEEPVKKKSFSPVVVVDSKNTLPDQDDVSSLSASEQSYLELAIDELILMTNEE